jgi:hypothetical protein
MLELSVPCCTVRRLQWPLSPVPKERTQLEPFLAAANGVDRPLVAQIDVLANDEALGVFVRENGGTGRLGLAYGVCSARII